MLLRIGSTGPEVSGLQRSLNLVPPTRLKPLSIDGIFGPLTRGRVLEFQGQNRLDQDGIVGPVTTEAVHDLLIELGFDTGKNDPNFVLPVRVNLNVAAVYLPTFKLGNELASSNFDKAEKFLDGYNIGLKVWPPGGGRQSINSLDFAPYRDPIPDTKDAYRKLRLDVNAQIQNRAPGYPFLVPVVFCEFAATGKAITPHSTKVGAASPACLMSMAAKTVDDKLAILHEMGHAALFPKERHNKTPGNLMHGVSGRTFLFRFQVEAFATAFFARVA